MSQQTVLSTRPACPGASLEDSCCRRHCLWYTHVNNDIHWKRTTNYECVHLQEKLEPSCIADAWLQSSDHGLWHRHVPSRPARYEWVMNPWALARGLHPNDGNTIDSPSADVLPLYELWLSGNRAVKHVLEDRWMKLKLVAGRGIINQYIAYLSWQLALVLTYNRMSHMSNLILGYRGVSFLVLDDYVLGRHVLCGNRWTEYAETRSHNSNKSQLLW